MNSFSVIADLSIPVQFHKPQVNAFGVDVPRARSLGDTRKGSSVNFDEITFVPHCHGTHTECVGHITHERMSVRECLRDVILPAVLVTVEPELLAGDRVISVLTIKDRLALTDVRTTDTATNTALIVRTLPNDESKLSTSYDKNNIPAYFTTEGMEFIVKFGFKHLLVDMPSIDRLYDEGKLKNHRIFWNVEPGSPETNANTRINSTITELIYVPNEIEDGEYLLNLQIAPFELDAAPSRPILIKPAE
ncbi:MAG: cyclase family protein [Acidobacteria bacterium]|nr:cyclase family protein [Acidobacteriota bacterium]